MGLQTTWFVFITVLWAGFFVLEGFDFGVGMLVPSLGRDEPERRALRRTTGPFWDGNEVWLVVAGAGTFAAFPDWYATMFSAYYLPIFILIVALIFRGVGVEYRDQIAASHWRNTWDWLTVASCALIPLLIGTVFGGLLNGLPIDGQKEFTGSFVDLVQPYALATGVLFTALCLWQGLMFLRLKTSGDLAARASRRAVPVSWAVVALLTAHITWTRFVVGSGVIPGPATWVALTLAVAAAWLATDGSHEAVAFGCSAATIAFVVFGFFGELHPNLMVSTTSIADNITVANSSSQYTLTLMTIVTGVMLPVVILYTAWNYWVFRQRVTVDVPNAPAEPEPSA